MSNKLVSLKKRSDFVKNRTEGVAYRTPFFVLRTMPWKKDEIGIGYVVSKKGIDKRAVTRNRVKRRLRALADSVLLENGNLGTAYVFYARLKAFDAPFDQMKTDLLKCLKPSS
ncbi:MAG: ribonuclease P protein component [Alphaproteobacteria bacterium]|nr:ribonuclease P protein component [Alphaproteobacteria bacterium]MBN2779844.1 ribonuclease P protein component [Alphaproteobacteria bacterium]